MTRITILHTNKEGVPEFPVKELRVYVDADLTPARVDKGDIIDAKQVEPGAKFVVEKLTERNSFV